MRIVQIGFEKTMYLAALSLYAIFASILLVHFTASIVWAMLFLSVIPIVVLWRLERLQTALLPVFTLLAIGAAAALEATAYINGIWYETSPSEWRLFDFIPAEAFLVTFVHILFFVVTYEFFFDDQKTSEPQALRHWPLLAAGAAVLFAFGLSYLYLFSGLIISNAFAYMLLGLLALAGVALWLSRERSPALILKCAVFAAALLPVTLAYEYVMLENNLRFFANAPEYLYSFTIGNQLIPIEELAFVILIPFTTALIYELFLDDAR